MKKTKRVLSVALAAAVACGAAWAQTADKAAEDALFGDETVQEAPAAPAAATTASTGAAGAASTGEDVFSSGEMVQDATASSGKGTKSTSTDTFLKNQAQGMRWGGSLDAELGLSGIWNTIGSSSFDLFNPYKTVLEPTLKATVFFDSRPDTDFRVFGKFKTGYPFDYATQTYVGNVTSFLSSSSTQTVPNIKIYELFSDFNFGDNLSFRFGKQTVKWGVGYFFSPADVINLSSIDASDPTADREGPVALRGLATFGPTTNLWVYLVLPQPTVTTALSGVTSTSLNLDPSYVAVAPKFETLIGDTEVGIGGYYQRNHGPRGIVTVTAPLWVFDVFGEAKVGQGSDRVYYSPGNGTPGNLGGTYSNTTDAYFSGTAGLSYTHTYDDNSTLTAYGQYYYNGEGYKNTDLLTSAYTYYAYQIANATGATVPTIAYWDRHYAAFSVSLAKPWNSKFTFSLLGIANLQDWSGYLAPTVAYKFSDYCSGHVGAQFLLGPDNSEYLIYYGNQRMMALTLGFTLGTGSF